MFDHRHGLGRRALVALGTAVAMLLAFAPAASADPLDDAKAAGYVGEKRNGMLGLVDPNAPASVKTLMNTVNAKRKDAYLAIAKENGASLTAVSALAGKKAIDMTAVGNYVENASGDWEKKK